MKSRVTEFRCKYAAMMKGHVIDCGAGEGDYTCMFAQATRVTSIDIDREGLTHIRGNRAVASASALPFADNSFDSVWCCAVIEHISHDAIPELVRVCKSGGTLAVLTPNALSPFDPLLRIAGHRRWRDHPGHINLYTYERLRQYGEVLGEVRFLPWLSAFFARHPRLSHTLLLFTTVDSELKHLANRLRQ